MHRSPRLAVLFAKLVSVFSRRPFVQKEASVRSSEVQPLRSDHSAYPPSMARLLCNLFRIRVRENRRDREKKK
ncbi:hypothetical protein EYF80_003357 [Liparis tanakae]|uniref:Secreted protein n=1 Tax=Liparis tanakae TaxID=230148 RepID=A0A4Z2JA42_9TELE|nr:hypothetical protein EYF80_003357 [Liparis tanakae]